MWSIKKWPQLMTPLERLESKCDFCQMTAEKIESRHGSASSLLEIHIELDMRDSLITRVCPDCAHIFEGHLKAHRKKPELEGYLA